MKDGNLTGRLRKAGFEVEVLPHTEDGRPILSLRFQPQPPPTDAVITALVTRIHDRVLTLLRRRGLLRPDDDDAPAAEPPSDDQLLLAFANAGPTRHIRIPTGPASSRARRSKPPRPLCASYQGFQLHAATTVPAHDTAARERLLRYLLRPEGPHSRIRLLPDGHVAYDLKRPRNGVRTWVFEPLAFAGPSMDRPFGRAFGARPFGILPRVIARLATWVAPPRFHRTRFFGVLAPGSTFRRHVVPRPPDPATHPRPVAPARPKRMGWVQLHQRVFNLIIDCTRRSIRGNASPHHPSVPSPAGAGVRAGRRAGQPVR